MLDVRASLSTQATEERCIIHGTTLRLYALHPIYLQAASWGDASEQVGAPAPRITRAQALAHIMLPRPHALSSLPP
eukprot:411847-Pyramimonas_sp.AAC.1